MSLGKFMKKLKDVLPKMLELLRSANDEGDVLDILSTFLGCEKDVQFGGFPSLVVDLVCDSYAIEVEFNKSPHVGLNQALAYHIYLGFNPILFHVLNYVSDSYKKAFKKLINSIKCVDIVGIVLDLSDGELLVFR